MGYGGKMTSDAMNAHKSMAGAGMKGDFGVGGYPGRTAKHPDVGMSHESMPDSARMAPMKGKMGNMQSAPDHGSAGMDHFTRGGKV